MRLIDADALKVACGILVDKELKGKWIYEEDGIIHGYCSCCGFRAIYQETDVFGSNFCPNCGADMREGGDQ